MPTARPFEFSRQAARLPEDSTGERLLVQPARLELALLDPQLCCDLGVIAESLFE